QSQYWLNDIEADWGSQTNDIAREVSLRGVGTFLEHARNYIKAVVSAADIRGEHHLKNNFISWGVKMQNEIIQDNIKEWALTDSSGYVLPNDAGYPGEEVPLDDPSRLLSFGKNSYLKAYNELNTFRFTGFVQDLWKIDGDNDTRFFLLAGVRFHYWTFNHEFTASPRLSFVYKPRWKHDWEFRLKTGLYYQPAFYREMRDKEGNLNHSIKSQRSYQVVLSSEYNFRWWRRPFKFTAEAYYKYMDHLISYSIDNVRIDYSGKNDAFG
ncbi:MAG: TonB-dependent receptor, partial [Bacteroidales bacterium]